MAMAVGGIPRLHNLCLQSDFGQKVIKATLVWLGAMLKLFTSAREMPKNG